MSDLIAARIVRSHQRDFDCVVQSTGETIKATALGNLLKNGDTLVVGDYVQLQKINDKEFIIKSVEERKNEIFRILVREAKRKVTASNCDYLVILNSVSKPKYKRGIIERFLVRAYQWGLEPIVVFNKMDTFDESEFDIQFEKDRLDLLNIDCFEISALHKDYAPRYLEKGLLELKNKLSHKTSLFVGQSGVGKSQTISCLSEGAVQLKTNAVGKGGKGSHTTTWSEIVECGDFYLIDSPGIRSFSLDDIDPDTLIEYFPDIHELATKCSFTSCGHRADQKGCYFFSQECEEHPQNKQILSRLESFLEIKEEVSSTPIWQKKDKYR